MNLPPLHGNWVDLIIILMILFSLWSNRGRGVILGMIDLGGFLLSFVAALKLYLVVGNLLVLNFSLPHGIANAVGFLLSGFLAEISISFLIRIIVHQIYPAIWKRIRFSPTLPRLMTLNRILGIIPILGETMIFTAFLLTLLVTLPIAGTIKKDIIDSKLGGPLVVNTQSVEGQLNRIFGEAVTETLTFLTVTADPSSGERVDLGFKKTDGIVDGIAETLMVSLVNNEREKAGLKKLIVSVPLGNLARLYAQDMFTWGYFSHYNLQGQSPFDRMQKKDISFLAAGENLALAPNVNLAFQGLMNSPGHRANILSVDFGKIGIGVIDGGIYGEMFVQEFTD